MPQATNLIINDGAATPVARTFVLRTPASGDNSPALWTLNLGAHMAVFPKLTVLSRAGMGAKASRKVTGRFMHPFALVDPSTGETRVVCEAGFEFMATLPLNFPESLKADFGAYVKNIVSNTLINECIRDGMPAT